MKFKNVNPSLLLKELSNNGIDVKVMNSNLKIGETVANEAWCDIPEDTNMIKVNEIVTNHNPNKVEEKEPTTQKKLNAQLLIENAEIKKQLSEQQELTASLLIQIAQLGGIQ